MLTGGGVLDLFAYNEDAYGMWLNNISNVANSNAKKGIENLNLKNQSRTQSRPASSRSTKHSRATVAPSDNLTNEEGSPTTLSIVNSKLLSSTSAGDANFTRGTAGAKVNSSSTGHGNAESESTNADSGSKHSLLSRSLSAPPSEQQLPLTTSTPLSSLSHTSQLQQQRPRLASGGAGQASKSGFSTYTAQDATDSDVI